MSFRKSFDRSGFDLIGNRQGLFAICLQIWNNIHGSRNLRRRKDLRNCLSAKVFSMFGLLVERC